MLWAFQNGIAHVCSYSQSLDQFGFAIGVRNLYSIHIRKGTAVPIPDTSALYNAMHCTHREQGKMAMRFETGAP